MEQGGRKGKAAAPASSSRLPERQQQQQQPKKCPRCESTNTKFCYFNNYSSSQPRHFCKACRRYWTEGGTLRNVPQGGASTGHRRNKRPRRSSSSSASLSSSSASTSSTTNNHHHSRLLRAHSSPAEVGVDPLLMPPPPPPPQSFFYGGGLGLPPFHPGNGGGVIGGDLTAFPAAVEEEMAPPPPPQGNPLLLPGFGFPLVEQQLLAPFDGAGLVVHQPRAPLAFSQQMIHATVFSTTTAGPATTAAAAGSDRGEPFWVSSFGGGSGDGSSRWGADNSFDRGSGPRPPPSSFI